MPRWTTQDPLAEKYFSISPYAYCAANPINLTDPTGRSIWIILNYDKQTGKIKEEVQYKEGKLFTRDGNEYSGDNEYAKTILETLNELKNSNDDKESEVLSTLEKSTLAHKFVNQTNIRETRPAGFDGQSKANIGIRVGSFIRFDLSMEQEDYGVKLGPKDGIVHELYHAYDLDSGNMAGEYDGSPPNANDPAEIRAVNFANRYRVRHGLPQRVSYGNVLISPKKLKNPWAK